MVSINFFIDVCKGGVVMQPSLFVTENLSIKKLVDSIIYLRAQLLKEKWII